jgi:hypothetical protein
MTDFGLDDVFVGVMKGVIARVNPEARIIDLTHAIPPFDILQAAVKLAESFSYFPEGSVHTIVVDPGVGSERGIVCMQSQGHLFLAPDNGVLTAVASTHGHEALVEVTDRGLFLPDVSGTFHGRDVFAPVAARLAAGLAINRLGASIAEIERIDIPSPRVNPDKSFEGIVLWSDRFGNLITNFRASAVKSHFGDERLVFRIGDKDLGGLHKSFGDVPKGASVAVAGSFGAVEICIREGNAAEFFQARRGTPVSVFAGTM